MNDRLDVIYAQVDRLAASALRQGRACLPDLERLLAGSPSFGMRRHLVPVVAAIRSGRLLGWSFGVDLDRLLYALAAELDEREAPDRARTVETDALTAAHDRLLALRNLVERVSTLMQAERCRATHRLAA